MPKSIILRPPLTFSPMVVVFFYLWRLALPNKVKDQFVGFVDDMRWYVEVEALKISFDSAKVFTMLILPIKVIPLK